MGDAALVGGGHRVDEGHRELEETFEGQPASRDDPAQWLAPDQLHREEGRPLAGLVSLDGVDGDDVGVVERGHRPRLAFEALEGPGVVGHGLRQALQRDLAPEVRVEGAPDDAAPALAERFEEAVVEQRVAGLAQASSLADDPAPV